MEPDPVYLVCASWKLEGAEESFCYKCGAAVYPSKGSTAAAVEKGIEIMCVECFKKLDIDQGRFGGIMSRGTIVNEVDEARAKEIYRQIAGVLNGD